MLDLAALLVDTGLDPAQTLVFRHRPSEPRLRQVLGWLAEEEPDLFNLYQSTHGPRTQAALMNATILASFVGYSPGRAVLAGVYRRTGQTLVTRRQCSRHPGFKKLVELGMDPWDASVFEEKAQLFQLQSLPDMAAWKGRLVIEWPPPDRSWYRWGSPTRNRFPIAALHEDSLFVRDMPPWDEIIVNWAELKILPVQWQERLAQWRGIYLIFDDSDGKAYVGSAGGGDNLLGRWLSYAASGHGGNQLCACATRCIFNFRYSSVSRLICRRTR